MPQQRAHEWLQALPRVCAKAERDIASLSMAVAVRAAANAIAACLSTYASTALERAQAERVKGQPKRRCCACAEAERVKRQPKHRCCHSAATNAVAVCLSAAASTALESAHRLGESAASPNIAATIRAAADAIAEANSGRSPVYTNVLATALNRLTNGGVARESTLWSKT